VTAPLDSFRLLVAADDALQTELAGPQGPDAFAEKALAIAGRHGLDLAATDLSPLTAPDPLGLSLYEPPPLRSHGLPPPGWLPCRFTGAGVDWTDFRGIGLDGSFHTGAVRTALARPLNRLLRCRMELDDFLASPAEGLRAPDGFIFHMSRCGSTLVARMLAALPDTYAINEAEPLDALLRAIAAAPDELQVTALRAIVGALGRRPSRRWFLKLSAWPALALPLFRRAFPDVPWLFIYRDPAEVLASQMAMRGPELEPVLTPPALFGLDAAAMAEEDYCAAALARICGAALAADGGLFVDHAELPHAFFTRILPYVGVGADEAASPALRELPRRHAKYPDRPWRPAAAAIGPAIRAAADAHLAPLYARLGAVRG
jgi:hypothetical protein